MNKSILTFALGLFCTLQLSAQKELINSPVYKTLNSGDTLSFLHITDLHVICDQKTFTPDFMEYRKRYQKDEIILNTFLKDIPKQTKSEMVVATGDLIDFFEVDIRDPKYLESQVRSFSKTIKESPVPVYCTLGNHDLFSFFWKDGKLKHDQNAANRSRAYWVRNASCFHNGTTYSKIIQVGQTTYRLIFLDNGMYEFKPAQKSEIPYIDKAQVCWLKSQLQASPDDVEIILMHIPFEDLKAGTEYDNELYSILKQDNAVKLILAGHTHKNHVSTYPATNDKQITQVQTSTLSKGVNHFRQIRLTENNILVSAPGKSDNEVVIPVK